MSIKLSKLSLRFMSQLYFPVCAWFLYYINTPCNFHKYALKINEWIKRIFLRRRSFNCCFIFFKNQGERENVQRPMLIKSIKRLWHNHYPIPLNIRRNKNESLSAKSLSFFRTFQNSVTELFRKGDFFLFLFMLLLSPLVLLSLEAEPIALV